MLVGGTLTVWPLLQLFLEAPKHRNGRAALVTQIAWQQDLPGWRCRVERISASPRGQETAGDPSKEQRYEIVTCLALTILQVLAACQRGASAQQAGRLGCC